MHKYCIPEFPDFIDISLKHKDVIEDALRLACPEISELNFTELFVWRNSYKASISQMHGNICIKIKRGCKRFYYPPIGTEHLSATIKDIFEWHKGKHTHFELFGLNKESVKKLSDKGIHVVYQENRDLADYVHYSSDLIQIAGQKYSAKRNLIKQFKRKYPFEYVSISKDTIQECVEFQKKWCRLKLCGDDIHMKEENDAVIELLDNFSSLSVFGSLIRIDKQIEAFTVGGKLNDQTAVVHIEKANPKIKGIYQMINQIFCETMLNTYKFVNREQDMGNIMLRKAKMSYYPHHIVEKGTIISA